MKKRNPNDSTFRNINALKKRVSVLENDFDLLRNDMIRFILDVLHSAKKVKAKKK